MPTQSRADAYHFKVYSLLLLSSIQLTLLLIVHDFFKPNPVKDAAIYFMRVVIHDWPDAKAKLILQNVRSAASTSSKLVLFDTLALHTCGPTPLPAPEPLLPNLGIAASGFFTALDVEVGMHYVSGQRPNHGFRCWQCLTERSAQRRTLERWVRRPGGSWSRSRLEGWRPTFSLRFKSKRRM